MRADAAPPEGACAGDDAGARPLRFDFAANPLAVRAALERVLDRLAACGVGADDRALCEIVLAEILNNVVEHAYGRAGGWIELMAEVTCGATPVGGELHFTVSDWGHPMPGGILPSGSLPPVAAGDLPEGGFGWHLIRALSSRLDHGREGGRNWLRVSLTAEQRAPLG